MKTIKKIDVVVIFMILTLLCFGLGDSFAQSVPKKGGMIKVGLHQDLTGLDPHQVSSMVYGNVMCHVFERLIDYGEKFELVPVLAERWEASPDYKTYTFYLRKGKLFHNGREMVADDVKYSIERIRDPQTGSPRRYSLKNIDCVEVVDKYTVRFHMKKPDAGIPAALAFSSHIMAVVPREEVEKQGGVMSHPVGTGPYEFVEWKPDRYLLLKRFDQYKPQTGAMNGFGGERIAYIDKIKYIPLPEESVAMMALLNKEVDILNRVPLKNIEKLQRDYSKQGLVIDSAQGLTANWIVFGVDKPITRDVKFRKACAYAIDRETVMKAAVLDYGVLNTSLIAAVNQYHTPSHKKWYNKDVEKAKKLLKESEYKGEEITIYTTKKFIEMYRIALVVNSELQSVGIKTKIEVLDWAAHLKHYFSGNFKIISIGISPQPDPTQAYRNLRHSRFVEKNPRVKEIIEKSAKTLDFAVRKKLFEEAQRLVYEEVPCILFYNRAMVQAHWGYIKGYKIWSNDAIRLWNVWIERK